MLNIRFNVDDQIRQVSREHKRQIDFALAQTVNKLAKLAQAEEKKGLASFFDTPTPFTVNSVAIKAARKGNPTAGCELTRVIDATKNLIKLNPEYYVRSYFYNNVANITAQPNCYFRVDPSIENAFVILASGMVLTTEDIPFYDQSIRWWRNDDNVGKIGNWLIGGQGGIVCLGSLVTP